MGRNAVDAAMVAEIDRTMKKYADNLLHVLEGVSARLTQLESRTCHVETSVDDLKGSADGKMLQLENILREVQTGVQALKDKQETVEAQLQFAKLQVSKEEPQPEHRRSGQVDSMQQAPSIPQQSHQLPPVILSQPPHAPTPQQNVAPLVQLPNHLPQSQISLIPRGEPYFPPPGQTPEVPNQQYQLPPTQYQPVPQQ